MSENGERGPAPRSGIGLFDVLILVVLYPVVVSAVIFLLLVVEKLLG